MTFAEKLNDLLTKESGGRHGGKGHEFQRYWALCHLLKIDSDSLDEYLMLLEFIEDVVVLNSDENPTKIDLYQIKKKEEHGKWTKSTLLKSKESSRSILSKLVLSKQLVNDEIGILSFVSNAPIELKLLDCSDSKNKLEFDAAELDKEVAKSIVESVAKELGVALHKVDLGNLKFIRSNLSIGDLESHAVGVVSNYLANKFPDHSTRADSLCKALYSEIAIRATSTVDASNFEELKSSRGISRSYFSSMLTAAFSKKTDYKIMEEIVVNLTTEQVPYVCRERIKRSGRRFFVDKVGKHTEILESLKVSITDLLDKVPEDLITSWDVAAWITAEVETTNGNKFVVFEKDYLLAVVLYWMYQ